MSSAVLDPMATRAATSPVLGLAEYGPGLVADSPLLKPRNQALKRLFDFVVASVLTISVLPLALVIALAVALETRGPIFFVHTRLGKNRHPFRLWKFRSMRPDADQVLARYLAQHPELRREWHSTRKLKNDARVTRFGRWLRRSSLDELPQLWNVLCGTMSLVGPRPIVREEIVQYGTALENYGRVLPGLTGLWQVSGRTNLSYHRRVDLDAEYIREWSFALDLKILCKTVCAVLRGQGAY